MKLIGVTLGEPAGIGPDLGVLLAQKNLSKNIIFIADPALLIKSSKMLRKKININILEDISSKTKSGNKVINVLPIMLNSKNTPGKLNPKNSAYVLETIRTAAKLCISNKISAMVTGPISKSVLNKGGYKISGHTEFLAGICKSKSVMMLMNSYMRVALHTTHVPLEDVKKYITKDLLTETINIIKVASQCSDIVGADINELSPIKGFNSYNFLAAKLAYKIISYSFEFKKAK